MDLEEGRRRRPSLRSPRNRWTRVNTEDQDSNQNRSGGSDDSGQIADSSGGGIAMVKMRYVLPEHWRGLAFLPLSHTHIHIFF